MTDEVKDAPDADELEIARLRAELDAATTERAKFRAAWESAVARADDAYTRGHDDGAVEMRDAAAKVAESKRPDLVGTQLTLGYDKACVHVRNAIRALPVEGSGGELQQESGPDQPATDTLGQASGRAGAPVSAPLPPALSKLRDFADAPDEPKRDDWKFKQAPGVTVIDGRAFPDGRTRVALDPGFEEAWPALSKLRAFADAPSVPARTALEALGLRPEPSIPLAERQRIIADLAERHGLEVASDGLSAQKPDAAATNQSTRNLLDMAEDRNRWAERADAAESELASLRATAARREQRPAPGSEADLLRCVEHLELSDALRAVCLRVAGAFASVVPEVDLTRVVDEVLAAPAAQPVKPEPRE